MHDPMTVAHEVYLFGKKDKNGRYNLPLITVWHVDPEKDGTDDSCGWFIRQRHVQKELLEKVRKEFQFEFKNNYWFNDAGYPKFSTMGVALEMYSKAAWTIFMFKNKDNPSKRASRQYKKFMRKHLFDILHFAENPTDSIGDSINMKYGVEKQEERINNFVSIITSDIMRKITPWYKHPRWHIWHWKIQFHPWQKFKRRYLDKCSMCGKRGFTGSAYGDWDGTKIWCEECNQKTMKPIVDQNLRDTA